MKAHRSRRKSQKSSRAAKAAGRADFRASAHSRRASAIVIGAGAFGGWSALHLLRRGAKVTLLDAWGPGNSRASSGGETRIIRATYGPVGIYTRMVARALELWQENQKRWKLQLFFKNGALRMAPADDSYERAALPLLKEAGIPFEKLSAAECSRRWPQINFGDVSWAIHEPDSGYLLARRACEAVLNAFLEEGGAYRQAHAAPGALAGNRMQGIRVEPAGILDADVYVFACGPWLGQIFPRLAPVITPTRQEVFFFGTPAGDSLFTDAQMPAWIDGGAHQFYGIPGNQWRGFKIADDARGAPVDPSTMDRQISAKGLWTARDYLRLRFPQMAGAPLLESRVCQYENSADHNLILDRHPEAENVWIAGGGSGHGFKHGPVVGEMVANAILDAKTPPSEMRLAARLANAFS